MDKINTLMLQVEKEDKNFTVDVEDISTIQLTYIQMEMYQ